MQITTKALAVAALTAFTLQSSLQAQIEGPLVTIETVRVGDAGNAADTNGYGAVASEFAIGKYEVTIDQYVMFLNSVASLNADPYGLYNPSMASSEQIAGIIRSGVSGSYSYAAVGPYGSKPSGAESPFNRPIAFVSWFDAARFANWVNNGATNGASTETGAYTLNGATSGVIQVNPGATWFLPSEDQWYKAAYYKSGSTNAGYWDYPTQSDTAPGNTIGGAANQANYNDGVFSVTQSADYLTNGQNYLTDVGAFSNSASAYGTFDQGGNLQEWNDAVVSDDRGLRGGAWTVSGSGNSLMSSSRNVGNPGGETMDVGFRLATVPEPSTYALALMGAGALWLWRRRKVSL